MRRILRVDVRQIRREDLKVERMLGHRRVQHVFEIPWTTLSATDRTTLDQFFQDVRGRYGAVEFTDPWDSVAYDCRLDADDLALDENEPTRWGSTVRLIEIANFKALKAAVTTFPTLTPGSVVQYPYRMERLYRTEIGIQEDKTEKRYEDFANAAGVQRWAVGGDSISDAEATTLLNAWEGNQGPYRAFTSFTEPQTGTVYTSTHFVETECIHELVEHSSNRVRLSLQELK